MEIYIKGEHTYNECPSLGDYPMHIHNNSHEIFCFLSGDACYSVEGNRYPLKHGDLMLMRKGEVHHLILKSNARYERLVVNFDIQALTEFLPMGQLLAPFEDRSLGKYNHYPASLFPGNQWLTYLEKICRCTDDRQKLCYLLPLLSDLAESMETVKTSEAMVEKDRATAVIKYINLHLCDELSLESLAEHFYLSKTHLNRIFKQSTGTTVWDYITVKRLFHARELIHAGESPTKVYPLCGFLDYTTFYRAYKQHFGISPKNDTGKTRSASDKIVLRQDTSCESFFSG